MQTNQDEPLSLVLPDDSREASDRREDDDWAARFGRGSVQFVGTATVLIRYGGFTILTDPNFLHQGDHVHLGYGLTSPRLTEPAFGIEELPPVDLVLLSHLHGDHFDHLVEEKLDHRLPIVTTPAGARALQRKGFHGARGLETWQRMEVSKGDARLTITSVPARHAPGPLALMLPPVMGSVLDWRPVDANAPTMRLYVSGDTLLRDELREIAQRFPEIDLALLHLGGTRIFGVLLTMDARQGVEAIRWIPAAAGHPHPLRRLPGVQIAAHRLRARGQSGRARGADHYLQRGQLYELEVPPERWSHPARARPAASPRHPRPAGAEGSPRGPGAMDDPIADSGPTPRRRLPIHGASAGASAEVGLARDPVCGMMVREDGPLRATFQGTTYFFCNPRCRERFQKIRGPS